MVITTNLNFTIAFGHYSFVSKGQTQIKPVAPKEDLGGT